MDYSEMQTMIEEMMQDPVNQKIFLISMIASFSIVLILELVMYILGAVGVRRLSDTAGLKHPSLAFVPILRWMMLGRLAEQYRPLVQTPRKPFAFSVHLPVLMTCSTVLNAVYSTYYAYYMFLFTDQVPTDQLAGLMNGVSIAFSVINMIATVILLVALFRIFHLIGHASPMLMTLLCALVSFCLPLFMFVYRKSPIVRPSNLGDDTTDHHDDDNGFYYDR